MPDPRASVQLEGIQVKRSTYKIDNSTITYDSTKAGGSSAVGKAVTLSGDSTVALTADGDAVVGKLVSVEADNTCSVEDDGYVSLPGGASATLTRGSAIVGALGAASAKGYVRSAASGTAAELIKCRGMIVDVSDTTKTVVKL